MKNAIFRGLCAAAALYLLLCIAGCGSVAGRYDLTSITTGEETVLVRDIPNAPPMYLHLNSDGTGIMLLSDEAVQMHWDDSFIWAEGAEDEKIVYILEDQTLTMSQNGQKMVFTKAK